MSKNVKEIAALFVKLAEKHPDAEVMLFDGECCTFYPMDENSIKVVRGKAHRYGPKKPISVEPYTDERYAVPEMDRVVVSIGFDGEVD